MKKFFVLALLAGFSGFAFAENYSFPASQVREIEVVVHTGTLQVKQADTKSVELIITPDAPESFGRNVRLEGDKELKIYAVDGEITPETVMELIVPAGRSDIEINSRSANIEVKDISGSLNIDAAAGKVNIENFEGDFDIDTVEAEVNAAGIFKELDIESTRANVNITLNRLPSGYDYEIQGAGNIIFNTGANVKKNRVKVKKDEFYGTFEIK